MKRRLLLIAAVSGLVGVGVLLFLLCSGPGFNLILSAAATLSGGAIRTERSDGALLGDWRLAGLVIEAPGVTVSIRELACVWRPSALRSGTLHIADLTVRGVRVVVAADGGSATPHDDAAFTLPSVALPAGILVNRIVIEDAVVRDASSPDDLFAFIRLSAGLRGGRDVFHLDAVELRATGYGGRLDGSLTMASDWPLAATGSWWLEPAGFNRLQGDFTIAGTLANPELGVTMSGPGKAELKGQVNDLFNGPDLRLRGSAQPLSLQALAPSWPDLTAALTLEAEGGLDDYRGRIGGALSGPALPRIEADVELSGSADGLTIETGRLVSGQSRVSLAGRLDWHEDFSWDGTLTATAVDPSLYQPLPQGQIDAVITTSGGVAAAGIRYRAEIADLHGTLTESALKAGGGLTLEGDGDGLTISAARLHVGPGNLEVSGRLDWTAGFGWEALLRLDAFDPSFLRDLPEGSINGEIASSGTLRDEEVAVTADIHSLSGTLAGYELSGGGSAVYRDRDLTVAGLFLENGGNVLRVDGTAADTLDLRFSLDGADLDRLLPALHGDFSASGTLTGTREQPLLEASGASTGLSYDTNTLAGFAARVRAELTKTGPISVALQADEIRAAGQLVQQPSVRIDGTLSSHRLTVEAVSDAGTVTLAADGSLDGLQQWQAHLAELVYRHPGIGTWTRRGDATISVSAAGASLEALCVESGRQHICAAGAWSAPDGWSAEITDIRLDLANLSRLNLFETPLTGELQGRLAATGSAARIRSATGRLLIPELSMNLDEAVPYSDFRWFDTEASLSLKDETLQAALTSRFVDSSHLDLAVTVERFGNLAEPLGDLPLTGSVNLDIRDLSPLMILTDDYLIPSGHILADLSVGGVLSAPLITGGLRLLDGSISFPELGIMLTEITADVSGQGDRLTVRLDASSGEGTAHGSGDLFFGVGDWSGAFTITGSDFELMKQRDLTLAVDPDVQLTLDGDGGSLTGRLFVPTARIEPEEMQGSDSESNDVVFVDVPEETTEWPFRLDLEVRLGDDVQVEGYGLAGNLKGTIAIVDRADSMTGRGELYLENGTFSVYGRSLNISRGRLLFSGGPIDNPGLDVSATKTIKDERQSREDIVVGINVSGTVHDYSVELFSNPAMEDKDIVAYIVMDRVLSTDDDQESGILSAAAKAIGLDQGNELFGSIGSLLPVDDVRFESSTGSDDTSLVVGKRLTDELYLSYDLNLFKNQGFFRVRYDFGRGFSVESKSSAESNGVDLLYSFER